MSGQLARGAAYRVDSYPGVAWRFVGQATYVDEWSGDEVEHDWVRLVMIGDDRVHEVDPSEVHPLDAGEFCTECGQVGCGWGEAA